MMGDNSGQLYSGLTPIEEYDKALHILRRHLFTDKHVANGTGLSMHTVHRVRNGYIPKAVTLDRLVRWMREIKDELP
jgi:hypothetical protein